MQRRTVLCKLVSAGALLAAPAFLRAQDAPMTYRHHGPEAPDDTRYEYHWKVLQAALEATVPRWGPFSMSASGPMSERRQILEMQKPDGEINTLLLDTTAQLERDLLPVRIPVDRGLLGYRVFLIRAEMQERLAQVRTLDQLKTFVVGQQYGWSDVEVYRAAGFRVVTASKYEHLFSMLVGGRFDLLGRGVTEVLPEFRQYGRRLPGMAIESTLLLHYPLPVFFWQPKTGEGRKRAARIEEGLKIIAASGQFDMLYHATFDPMIRELGLGQRHLLRIDNPLVPPASRNLDRRWYLDPEV